MSGEAPAVGVRPPNRLRPWVWGGAMVLLLIPAIAMQFTSEMNWDESDFIFMGVMLFVACGTYELAARASGNSAYRTGVGIAVVASFLTIWINLAVGMIGNEENPLNLMYGGVILTALVGSLLARFRSAGMARAMTTAAVAQLLVAVVAQLQGHFTWGLTIFFGGAWLLAAGLFRKAAEGERADAE